MSKNCTNCHTAFTPARPHFSRCTTCQAGVAKKKCIGCGKDFRPGQPHHQRCATCQDNRNMWVNPNDKEHYIAVIKRGDGKFEVKDKILGVDSDLYGPYATENEAHLIFLGLIAKATS